MTCRGDLPDSWVRSYCPCPQSFGWIIESQRNRTETPDHVPGFFPLEGGQICPSDSEHATDFYQIIMQGFMVCTPSATSGSPYPGQILPGH